jgi:hypothetical protein
VVGGKEVRKKHITCLPKTIQELKKHLEKNCCNPIIGKEMFLDLIYRLEELESELQ